MFAATRIPIVFLACVNSYRKGKRLRYLVHERKAIAALLGQSGPAAPYQAVEKGNRSDAYFFDLLRQHEYHERVEVLHFTGHTDNNGTIRIESEDYETHLPLHKLSDLVAALPRLKVVFLSGCATPALLETLLRRDIPAVIATQSWDKDAKATAIAQSFYTYLEAGYSLEEIFRLVSAMHPEIQPCEVDYDIEQDELKWEGKELLFNGPRLPWGMYYLRDNIHRLREANRRSPVLPVVPIARPTRRWMGLAAAAALLGFLAVGITLILNQPDELAHLFVSWRPM
ncbi:MAG: hypothetical protein OHK0039_27340 [Bacteroidia bacterium]